MGTAHVATLNVPLASLIPLIVSTQGTPLPAGIPAFETFYKIAEFWPEASRERLRRNIAGES